MKWLVFSKEGIEGVNNFGRERGWMELRCGERRRWNKEKKEEWGRR